MLESLELSMIDCASIPCNSLAEINDEMIHSTGYYKRLNRLESGASAGFGSETYSKEELTAEIGSAMILNRLGIETDRTFSNSTAYIQNWLRVLRNDNKFIISSSSKSEKAVKYIFNENTVTE